MFTQRITLTQQDARKTSVDKLHELGAIAETADGRVWRYAQAGGSNLAAGLINVGAAKVANHTNNAVAAAAAVDAKRVSVTLAGATATTAGQYEDGYLVVNDSAGVGCAYRISGSPVIAGSGTGFFELEDPIKIALTTSSKVSLQYNPFAGSIVNPGAIAHLPNGSNNVAVTAAYYYWSQTRGIASVLSDGIIAKGAQGISSDAVAGALETRVDATIVNPVSVAPEATVDTKYYPQYLILNY